MTVHLAQTRAPLAFASLLVLLLPHSGTAVGATFTVGTGGGYATIQAALVDANLAGGDDEIRIRSGTYVETVQFFTGADERFELSGGWDATFTVQTEDPALTVIDAANTGRALHIEITDGTVVVRNLTITRGAASDDAGFDLVGRGHAEISLTDCVVNHSVASNESVAAGGGGSLVAYHTSRLEMARCAVHDNRVESASSQASGGGLSVFAANEAQVALEALQVFDNEVVGATHAFGGGMDLSAFDASRITAVDSSIEGNSVASAQSPSASGVYLEQGVIPTTGARIEFRRNRVVGNIGDVVLQPYQVNASAGSMGGIVIGDSLIADGVGSNGLVFLQSGVATLEIVNLTSAGNANIDLRSFGGGSVANSLAGQTSLDIETVLAAENLLDVDPGYVDAANGDYHLAPGSPAIGAGSFTPLGGLGPNDLDGKARRIGMGVDLGAFEADDPVVYVDSFE